MDLESLFGFSLSPWELVVRGTAIYWFLFIVFRYVFRRDVGAIAVADVLLLVIIADAAQNAMAGGYESISDGLVLISTIIGWNYALDWASYRFPAVRRFAEPKPLPLISHGRLLKHNLRREFLTPADVESELRKQGIADISQVVSAHMEPDGQISVIRAAPAAARPPHRRDRPA